MQDELTIEQQAQFKQQLLGLQKSLLEDLSDSTHATDTVTLDQQSVGRLSRMDAMQMQQMALETQRRNQSRLLAIARALKQIESGDFGYCAQCGEVINPNRLAVNATVTRCIECAH